MRACDMVFAVGTKLPVAGSYSSAVGSGSPPAISTLPSRSKVAVCPTRSVDMLPVSAKVPAGGRDVAKLDEAIAAGRAAIEAALAGS